MRPVLFSLLLIILASCTKDQGEAVATPAGGTWTMEAMPVKAAYSELDTRKGYLLRFSDSLSVNTVSFLFRTRPEGESVFTAATDTAKSANVVVRVERDGVAYRSAAGGEVRASLPQGKLYLRGSAIKLQPELGGPELSVDFQLREF